MLDPALLEPERPRPLRRGEYEQLVATGAFANERVELLRGVLVAMSPQGALHATVTMELVRLLVLRVGDRASVRPQLPFAADDESLPEPDVAVVPRQRVGDPHPDHAFVVIEVSDASLRKDRAVKAELYAAAGVPEYWIVDLEAAIVEVHLDPAAGGYRRVSRRARGEVLQPIALPGVEIAVAEILP